MTYEFGTMELFRLYWRFEFTEQHKTLQLLIVYIIYTITPRQMFYFVLPSALAIGSCSWILSPLDSELSTPSNEKLETCKTSVVENIILTPQPQETPSFTTNLTQPLNYKYSSLPKKAKEDEEYKPLVSSCKKQKKSKQMENRNVVPNIIRLILSYIQKKEKSLRVVEKLLAKLNASAPEATPQRYYLFQKLIRSKMNNYVNEDTLSQLCKLRPDDSAIYSLPEQRLYSKITRILIAEFLREDIVSCILTSKRMQNSKKKVHLDAIHIIKAKTQTLVAL